MNIDISKFITNQTKFYFIRIYNKLNQHLLQILFKHRKKVKFINK